MSGRVLPSKSAGRKSSGHRGGCATSRMKRRQSASASSCEPCYGPPAAAQWEYGAAPLTPASTPERTSFMGLGVGSTAAAAEYAMPVSQAAAAEYAVPMPQATAADYATPVPQGTISSEYSLNNVMGVWNGGQLFAENYRGLHDQL